LIVMRLFPRRSGISGALQVIAPVALPLVPVEFIHVTKLTPTLSIAIPWKLTVPLVVEKMVDPG
jgi:hypothetical protein